jgi:glycosyltransferase involved in cell wall biosynthesis
MAAPPTPIVFLLPDLGGGGAQQVMLTLATHLDPARFAPRLLVVGGAATLAVPPGLATERGGATRLAAGLPWLIRRLRTLRPAAVVSTPAYTSLMLLTAAALLPRGTRLVVREANMPAATLATLPGWIRLLRPYGWLYPRATRVLAQSAAIAAALAVAAPGAGPAIRLLPNPVDVDRLRTAAGRPVRPAKPGLHLVGAGRLTRQKGFDRLIEIMPRLPADSRLTVFGDGPDRPSLTQLIAHRGLADRVVLAGYSSQLAGHLAVADALVMTSRWEGLPNVALEALALGTPVVATPESALDEVAARAGGAVRIAPMGDAFVARLAALEPAAPDTALPRPSLLPDDYTVAVVVDRFQRILTEALV